MKAFLNVLFNLKNEDNISYIEGYNSNRLGKIFSVIFAAECFAEYLNADSSTYKLEWLVMLVLTVIGAAIICVSVMTVISALLLAVDRLFLKMHKGIDVYLRMAVFVFFIIPVLCQLLLIVNELCIGVVMLTWIIPVLLFVYAVVFVVYYVKRMYNERENN